MRHNLGRVSLLLVAVEYMTLNGPCRLGASFAFGCVVCMLVPSSQTRSPSLNSLKVLDGRSGPVRFMVSAAIFKAAMTSFWIWSMDLSLSSTVGMVVAKFNAGMNSGWYPYQTSNGEWPVAGRGSDIDMISQY